MLSPSTALRHLLPLALGLVLAGAAAAAPSANLEQVRNGIASSPTTPVPTWGTGNAGASNSHYLESHSIAYRTVMDGLPTDGTVIELIVGYDVKRSGSYAIDYLTQYQRLLPHVLFGHKLPEVFDPLAGVTGVDPTVTTAPIPLPTTNVVIDPDGAESDPAAAQPTSSMAALPGAERVMTLFGGTILDVSYDTQADVSLATSSSETRVRIRFRANGPRAVLAWGGHIACRWDWGFNADATPRSAGGISGSSYHMRLVNWNLGNLGNQDRSMSTDAVYPVPKCGVSNVGPFCAGSTNVHTAPDGMETYLWTLFDNTSGATIVGSNTGLSVTVQSGSVGGSYGLLLTTGASGFTKQCQATVTVLDPAAANAGADVTVCATSPQVQLTGWVSGGAASWSGGSGAYSPGASAATTLYTPSAGEIAAGGVTLTLTSTPPAGAPCSASSDRVRVTIQPAATANAGLDQVLCAANPVVQLSGGVGGSAVSGAWSGGAGIFSPSASVLNATYVPTAEEIAAGSVTLALTSVNASGPCAAANDQVKLTFNPVATADAGLDQTVCSASPQVSLAGVIGGGAATGTWSGGGGSFTPSASTLGATYTPSPAEIAAGGVTLTLASNDPAGPCGAATAHVRITILPAATANAGLDQTVCANSPQVQLAGAIGGGAVNGSWSGGDGSFSPSASAVGATYTPSAAEIAAGSVTLTLTGVTAVGPCPSASDQVKITINPSATASAGLDQTVCSSSPQVSLAGVIGGGATSGVWSGGGGSFTPSASALNAVYTPSAGEIAAGGVTLTLTSNDPSGPCGTAADGMRITILPAATANAGLDQTVCSSSPQVQLASVIGGGATSGAWSGGAGSFSPSASAANALYAPSAGEIAAGGVTLTWTSNDPNGPCGAASDAMRITVNPAATANAGADQRVCAGSPQVQLAGGLGGGATTGTWSGGAGAFAPSNKALNAIYTPTAAEIAAGSLTLTLATDDPAGPCGTMSDQMKITIDPITLVSAGLDQILCSSSPQAQLKGSVSGTVTTGSWSGGTGTFSPGRSALNATYTPSAAELAAGSVTLTLTSAASSGPCPQVSDAMTIRIDQAVSANAGPDQTVCAGSPAVKLAGTVSRWAFGGTWSGGAGTYTPNAATLNAIYTPSAVEIAAGSLTLTLTTHDPSGPCGPASDQMKITFDAPIVSVPTRVTCDGVGPVSLCANVSQGVAPYTYQWSNGATTQCIAVSDTGMYSVSITDSKGCSAWGEGGFHWRDCVGMLAHTVTTCDSYQAGTGAPLESWDVNWVTKDNVITSISPGVFFYFTKVNAPRPNFTVNVMQTRDNPDFPYCAVLQGQITLDDGSCTVVGTGVETTTGQASVNITGAQPGQVYIVVIKYSLKSLVGVYMTPTMGCHYDFLTQIDGQVVDQDPDGLQVGYAPLKPNPDETPAPMPRPGSSLEANGGDPIVAEANRLELYRPVPNPFHQGMRMAYEVGFNGAHVNVSVYDLAGRRVRNLMDGSQVAGRHLLTWDGRDDAGAKAHKGVYFVHVQIGGQSRQVRVTFLE